MRAASPCAKKPPERMGPRGAKDATLFRERLDGCFAASGEPHDFVESQAEGFAQPDKPTSLSCARATPEATSSRQNSLEPFV